MEPQTVKPQTTKPQTLGPLKDRWGWWAKRTPKLAFPSLSVCQDVFGKFFEIPAGARRIWITVHWERPESPEALRIGLRRHPRYPAWRCRNLEARSGWNYFVAGVCVWLDTLFQRTPLPTVRTKVVWVTVEYED